MLSELCIENLAVIQKLSLRFDGGFHVFTGATGTGKTILVSGISAVLGARIRRDLIRTGETKAVITAVFTGISDGAVRAAGDLGFPSEDRQIMIQREIGSDGRGSCRINGRPASLAVLRQVSSVLIDIHGQNESQYLLYADRHLDFLDNFGNYPELTGACRASFRKLAECGKALEKLNEDEAGRIRRMDSLDYERTEIRNARLTAGEEEDLRALRKRIRNAETISTALGRIYALADGDGDRGAGMAEAAGEAVGELDRIIPYLPEFSHYRESLSDLYYLLNDLREETRKQLDCSVYHPEQLDEVESRLDLIDRLKKKYGGSVEAVLQYAERIESEYADLQNHDELLAKATREHDLLLRETEKLAAELTEARRRAAEKFTSLVEEELRFLDMASVRFTIRRTEKPLSANGADDIEFFIQTNPGEDSRPLAKIASGGELSRIMLAIKNVLADRDALGTIIFDEVDTGVSGNAAKKIGVKLREVARHRQVLCVTHLPVVAAMADVHFKIFKIVRDGRTFTKVTRLDHDGRVREIAQLQVGDAITESALASAAELLES